MQSHAWADHLDISRAITVMGEHDLGLAMAWMGTALHLLQRDLLVGVLTSEEFNAAEPCWDWASGEWARVPTFAENGSGICRQA